VAGPTPAQRALLERLADALMEVGGVRAVALGGSRARGTARADSDLDVGLYVRDAVPLDLPALRAVAARFDPRPERVVTGRGEWGPWVDGGAWLRVEGQPVDLLYRSLDLLERWVAASARGERAWDYAQQPPFGFHAHVLLGELAACVPLRDPGGELAALKARVGTYPEALRAALLQDFLWHAEFALYHGRKLARRGDLYAALGCLTRASACLVQALHAEARRPFVSDAGALDALAPEDAGALRESLAVAGADPEAGVAHMQALHARVCARVGPAYRRPFDLARTRGA
jgi:predicted nucleotidyltransferase